MLNIEIWKKIKDLPYEVSSLGKVRNLKGKILKTYIQNCGYEQIKVAFNNTHKQIHRLVAEAFIPNPENLPEVNHINEIKSDNRVENLEWCSREYNYKYGTGQQRAKKNNQEKNGKRVKAIKGDKEYYFISVKEAERQLGLNHANIFSCLKGRIKTTGGYRFEEVSI